MEPEVCVKQLLESEAGSLNGYKKKGPLRVLKNTFEA